MTDVSKELTRSLGLATNTDANGKTWGIRCNTQTALYEITLQKEEEFVKPKQYPKESKLHGAFTKAILAERVIQEWLKTSWDYNDAQVIKATRKKAKQKAEKE